VNLKPSAQICSPLETGASFLFKARNFRLPAQTKNSLREICRIFSNFRTSEISSQIHRQISGARLMPNNQKLSHAAGDFRQPETRSENCPA
jgi:hypothetical protein